MYCFQCATPNTDGAKFCRTCGLDLKAVALVVGGKSVQPTEVSRNKNDSKTVQDWLEEYYEKSSNAATAAMFLITSLLACVVTALFVPSSFSLFPSIIFFFGTTAVWGAIVMWWNIIDARESKSRLRLMALTDKESAIDSSPQPLLSAGESSTTTDTPAAFRPSPPLSVTEGTTRQLNDSVET